MPVESHDLLRSGARAKWITSPDLHADDWGQTLLTRDHDVIRAWARNRAAEPARTSARSRQLDGETGLRFEFPGMTELETLSWEDWFLDFETHGLILAFRERRANGLPSQDYRIITPDQLEADSQRRPARDDPP